MKNTVKISDKKYPRLLQKIKSPPAKLYYKGNWDNDIFKNCLAVVGSRRMTSYGRIITNKLIQEIASAGITIVSGFMFGIDATAHQAAIDVRGRTIAVMPCGIDLIHPAHQEALYQDIIANHGLIISEFEGTFPPAPWTYPKRNRIVAGLSSATLVVEAAERSGSLITAGFAREFKRRLFAVPGPLTSAFSKGTAQLIKEAAEIVTSAKDVMVSYDITQSNPSKVGAPSHSGLSDLEQSIVEKLREEPMETDLLMHAVKTSASELASALSLMQIKGLIFKERGKYHLTSC